MRRLWLAVFLLLFLTYAYGRQRPANVNAVSRTATALAILEDGSACIDRYQAATCDKAFFAGHYYSDKAPGLSFAALPSIAAVRALLQAGGIADFYVEAATHEPCDAFKLLTTVGTIFTSGLMTAAAATALGWLCWKLGCSVGGALLAALAFGLATPSWGWATAFFGHALAGDCLLLGFVLGVATLESSLSPGREFLGWVLAGLLLGYAVVVEYPTAIAAAIIGAMIGCKAALGGPRRLVRAAVGGALGALPCAALLLAYNQFVFGSCLDLGYKHVVGYEGMKAGLVGLTYPRLASLYGIVASPEHGILWISPLLAVVPFAFWGAWRFRRARPYLLCAALVVVYFFAFNAAYAYWDGGWSTGPRHVTPALGFACLPLGFMWSRAGRIQRAVILSVFCASLFFSMACASIGMDVSPEYTNPLWETIIPDFLQGRASNLGELVGIARYWNLLPLAVLWAIGGVCLSRLVRSLNRWEKPVADG
jgi:hypothetical protein